MEKFINKLVSTQVYNNKWNIAQIILGSILVYKNWMDDSMIAVILWSLFTALGLFRIISNNGKFTSKDDGVDKKDEAR